MNISPLPLFKALAEDTRLKAMLLIQQEGELCVCELTVALEVSQPKISRHLAQLREAGLLADRREGQWVYYRIHPQFPGWANQILAEARTNNQDVVNRPTTLLQQMGNRPQRSSEFCC